MRRPRETVFEIEKLKRELICDARATGMPDGAAESVAEKIARKVAAWVEKRAVITQDDLYRKIAQEAAKYSQDLAYVYQNRGKII